MVITMRITEIFRTGMHGFSAQIRTERFEGIERFPKRKKDEPLMMDLVFNMGALTGDGGAPEYLTVQSLQKKEMRSGQE